MGVTIQRLEAEIEQKKRAILRLNNEIANLERRKNALINYENNKSIEDRTLRKYIGRDTKTVSLMDQFESLTEEGFQKYVRIIDTGVYTYSKDKGFQFIIERLNGREYSGDISMTDYKNFRNANLYAKAKNQIKRYLNSNEVNPEGNIEIMFDKPYRLRAQNSNNRSGYGSIYDGSDLIRQGTLYGETTSYAVVGIVYFNR